jgi:hypothetical protein
MSSESPFNVYLHTNYAPTLEEKATIETLCVDPLQDIQRLDKEIDKLEEEIASLHRRREELQTFVEDHRMLLSPIRQLSPEVLQRIFVECVAADCHRDFYAASYPVMLAAQAPMLLGRVCSSWRRLAYSTAELWNAFHVAIPNPEKGEADGSLATLRLEALKDWLGRTGSLALHISLFAAPSPFSAWNSDAGESMPIIPRYSHICQFAEALMEFADRWGSLTLYVPPPVLRPWSLLASRTLPMLKDVRLSYASQVMAGHRFYDVAYTDYQALEFLRQAPLESVTLSLFSTVHLPAFRKDVLTYLDIQPGLAFSDGYSLASFFADFINLCTLHFKFAQGFDRFTPVPERQGSGTGDRRSDSELVTLPCLEELNVSGFGDDLCCIVDFWRRLRAPKLQSMTFQLDSMVPTATNGYSHGMFARFMETSQCSILSINYHTSTHSPDDNSQPQEPYHAALIPYIRAYTQVTDLTIRFGSPEAYRHPYIYAYTPPPDRATMSSLNAGEELLRELFLEGDEILLPCLKNLRLYCGLPTSINR